MSDWLGTGAVSGRVVVVGYESEDVGRYAAVVADLAGFPVRSLSIDRADDLDRVLDGLREDVAAVLLAGVRPTGGLIAARVPVIADEDTLAIAVAATVLTTLARAGQSPHGGRVVIAGAEMLPVLGPLLTAAEVGDIALWRQRDAPAFPLRRVARDADVVVDLLYESTAVRGDGATVVRPDLSRDPLLALPGLLRALVEARATAVGLEVHYAAVLALVMATPPELHLPAELDRALADRVADAALRAMAAAACDPD